MLDSIYKMISKFLLKNSFLRENLLIMKFSTQRCVERQ